jgi:hypothetical protein
MSEPCKDSASKGRCLCSSMKAGMRSPGLYRIELEALDECSVEQRKASDTDEPIVRLDAMLWISSD